MSFSRSLLSVSLFTSLFSLPFVAHATDFTGFLYVSDYKAANLDRYRYDFTGGVISNIKPAGFGGNTNSAIFITGGIKEGVQGTRNDLIIVNSGGSTLSRYDLNGNLIGTIAVKNNDPTHTSHTLSSIGNVVVTQNGKYMYAPESGTGIIDKIDLSTGIIVNNIAFKGAHDLAIAADGTIYAASYSGSDVNSAGVWSLPSDLSAKHQMITSATMSSPSGMSISTVDGSLYVQQNAGAGPDGVYHFTISGTGTATTATFKPLTSLTSSSSLHFTFGNNIGPDGNLYIAALGGASGRAGNGGYTDGVYKFDTTSLGVSRVIDGGIDTGFPGGPSGLQSPKYLQFGYNFVPADDPGAPGVPEPSGVLAGLGFLGMVGGGILRTRRRRRNR